MDLSHKINKYLSNIIFQYIDYSVDSLHKIHELNKYKDVDIFTFEINVIVNTPLIDLISTCIKIGYKGFYKSTLGNDMFKQFIEKCKNDLYVKNNTIIIKYLLSGGISFSLDKIGKVISIDELITYLYYFKN